MAKLRDREADFRALIGAASDDTGLDTAFVEKDYWVTELLRSLSRELPGDQSGTQVLFKGGTSLSKAYRIIERFSEDVDVLVRPPAGFGKARVDRILKDLVERAELDLGVNASNVMSKTGVKRDVDFAYGGYYGSPIVRPGVRLEMGTRGGAQPNQVMEIRSMVADAFQSRESDSGYEDVQSVTMLVLAPERTLVEKLHLLHSAASAPTSDNSIILKAARHYYDVYRLLTNPSVLDRLAEIEGGVATLAADIHECSLAAGFPGPSEPRPVDGYGSSAAFARSGSGHELSATAYEAVERLVWGEFPPFSDVLNVVEDRRQVL